MFDPTMSWPLASRRRRLLAFYLDYLLIGGPIELVLWALEPLFPGLRGSSLAIRVAAVSVIEVALLGRREWSPGARALGVTRRATRPGETPDAERHRPLVVDPRLLAAERWWTLLLGVLLILDGTKLLIRWTQWSRPMPFLGLALDEPTSAVFQVILGAAECAVGVGVLRLRPKAVASGLLLNAFLLFTLISSWARLPDWISHEVVARRAAFGRVPRQGEIEIMVTLLPATMVLAVLGTTIWLVLALRRANRARTIEGLA